jgi:hypothetical protein
MSSTPMSSAGILGEAGPSAELTYARGMAAIGEDETAKQAYIAVLTRDPTHLAALTELGFLARAGGHHAAARTAYEQAVRCHPHHPGGHVSLANLLLEQGEPEAAARHYRTALAADPACAAAHQGLAQILAEHDAIAAEAHAAQGFPGHAIITRPYRGTGQGISILLLVSARGGNIPARHWISDRQFEIHVLYAEYYDPAVPLPSHALVVNLIGDADLCERALVAAEAVVARSAARLINPPARVRQTGRAANARRLAGIEGVITPRILCVSRASLGSAGSLEYPVLLRAPGYHTGQHFHLARDPAELAHAARALPGKEYLLISYLDARGADGFYRKYRVMIVGGVIYPLHLAIGPHWLLHYYSSAMADEPSHRAEELRFLTAMPEVLGPRAMKALAGIAGALGLDYCGVDFALAPDGALLLFEANATMVAADPGPDPRWDYRRPAIRNVIAAAANLLLRGTLR